MKSIVVYFSQTGNTKKIAQDIYAGLAEVAGKCDIARIQDVKNEDLLPYDLIGIGSPVWHRREPANVLSFIEYSMKSLEGKHAFIFCTHGLYPGHFIGRVVAALTLEGLKVIGWKNWYASVWLPEHPKPYFTDGHPDEIDLEEAREFGREIAERSRRVVSGENHLIPNLPVGREYHELYPGPGSTSRPGRRENQDGALELIDLRSFDLKVNRRNASIPNARSASIIARRRASTSTFLRLFSARIVTGAGTVSRYAPGVPLRSTGSPLPILLRNTSRTTGRR
jgi:flavodoxin